MARRNSSSARAGKAAGLGLFFFALLLAALAQWLVWQDSGPVTGFRQVLGWGLFALGGFLLSLARRRAKPQPQDESLPFAFEAGALILIVALAGWLRVHDLKNYPTGGFRDEGENGNVAIQMLKGEVVEGTGQQLPVYIEHNTQNAAGYFYPVAVAFKVFGISILSERYVSVFFGVLGVLGAWALSRWFFGPGLGLFLAASLAALRWDLNFSRIGFLGIMTVFLSLPMLVFLYKGLRTPASPLTKKLRTPLFALAVALAVGRGLMGFFVDPGIKDAVIGFVLGLPILWFAYKAWADKRSRWLMLGAVALALAMYSYIAARLFIVLVGLIVAHHLLTQQRALKPRAWMALVLSLAVMALGGAGLVAGSAWAMGAFTVLGKGLVGLGGLLHLAFWWSQRDLFKDWVKPLGLALGVGLVVAGPLYAYSLAHQKEVAARSYRVSIFNDEEADKRPWGIKLVENLGPTMGMMNVRGDGNPRHNLPNEITINPLWAALYALGVFYSLLRLKDPRAFLALSLWQISLLAGYYSIEAPQAYRCISAIPAVLLFMGLVLERGVTPLRRWMGDDGSLAASVLLLPLLIGGGAYELHTYFVRQPKHPGVWAEFSTGEYMMGQDLKALNGPDKHTRGLVKPDWADSYTFRFMTYPERNYEYFDVSKHVPIRPPQSTSGEDFLYELGQSYLPLKGVLKGFYPHGEFKEIHHPLTNELLYWTFRVDAAEAAAAGALSTGLKAKYYQDIPSDMAHPELGPHWVSALKRREQVDPFILFDWSVSPVPGFFSAEWTGSLKAPKSGEYQFSMASNSFGLLEIDGKKVAERPFLPPGADWKDGKIKLDAGRHRIRLRYYEARNYSRMELWWTRPGGTREVIPSSAYSAD